MFHRNSSQSDADKIRTIKELLSVKASLVALSSFDASQVDLMIQTLCNSSLVFLTVFYLYVVRFHNKYILHQQSASCRTNCQAPRRQHHSVDLLWSPLVAGMWQSRLQDCRPLLQSHQTTTFFSYLTGLSSCRQSRVLRSSTSDLLSTQSSSTNIAARRFPPFGTVFFPHLYALASLALGLSSRLIVRKTSCTSRFAVRTIDTLTRSFASYSPYSLFT